MSALPHRAGFLVCFLLLTACATAPAPNAAAVAPPPSEPDVGRHVRDYRGWLALQTPESLAAENSLLELAGSPRALLEKALLRVRTHDVAALEEGLAALAVLRSSSDPAAAAWQPVAALLASVWQADLQAQKSLLEQQEKLAQQLRDSQRRNDQLNDRVEQLGHKLEALKSIELNLPKPAGSTSPASLPRPAPAPRSPAPC